jgi:protein-S-isoprenylcysteine O-methyltransferase Ste14
MYSIHLGEKLFRLRGVLPFPLIAIMIIGSTFSTIHVALGTIGILLGLLLRLWTVGYIGVESRVIKKATAPRLCTGGPYRLIRNPLYLANMAIYLGFAGLSNTLSPWLPLFVLVIYGFIYSMIVRYEEDILCHTWQNAYKDYARLVPRWIPTGRPALAGEEHFRFTAVLKSERWTYVAVIATAASLILRWKFRAA